jgi:hypothetical protein
MKGGNEYSRFLRAQSFIESIIHIAMSMRIYLDETCIKIRKCVAENQEVSDWIRDKLNSAITKSTRCLNPMPRLESTEGGYENYVLYESVPVKGFLPAFLQKHRVRFKESSVCTCSCPHFISTRLPCGAVCVVLGQKGYVSIAQVSQFLFGMWLVKKHPLFDYATKIQPQEQAAHVGAPAAAPLPSNLVSAPAATDQIRRMNSDALRSFVVPSTVASRREYLSTLWGQILPDTILSVPSSKAMAEFLLQHRASLGNSQVLMGPPPVAISSGQERSGRGPAAEVTNLADKTAYCRSARKRVASARARDPSCFAVYKTGVPGQLVKCFCGVEHTNDKQVGHHLLYYI